MPQTDAHRQQLIVMLGAFAAFGMLFGVWQVLLADLSTALYLSPGPLGAALSIGFVASLPAMLLGGRVADRVGARTLGVAAGAILALSLIGFALVGSYAALVVVLLGFLAASGVYDVAVNAAAIGLERASRRRVLTLLHAAFSGGGATGALAAGLLIAAGIDFRWLYVATGILVASVMLAWRLGPMPPRAAAQAPMGGASLYCSPLLLLLAVITALGFLSEGAMESWSAIYLRSSLDLPALIGAGGVATFHAAMLVGRLGTGAIVGRLGRVATLRSAGVAAAVGMTLALATELPALILLGFLVVGLALAGVAPVAFSLAGDASPGRAGQASAVITTIGYGGFLFGPGLVGGVAELTSLRLALAVIVAAGLGISGLTTLLQTKRPGQR